MKKKSYAEEFHPATYYDAARGTYYFFESDAARAAAIADFDAQNPHKREIGGQYVDVPDAPSLTAKKANELSSTERKKARRWVWPGEEEKDGEME